MTQQHVLLLGQIYSIADRYAPGQILTEEEAELFGEIQADAVADRMETWLASQTQVDPRPEEIQSVASAFAETLLNDTSFAHATDPVWTEALALAREMILTKLAAQGLPAPKTLDAHAAAVITGDPELLRKARVRVEARIEVGRAALAQVEERAGVTAK